MPSTDPRAAPAEHAAAKRLGAYIRRLRRGRGDTLVRLAELTDLSHPFLSQLERGLAQPSLSSLRRIAVALGTSPVELVAAAEDHTHLSAQPPRVEVRRADDATAGNADFAEGVARMLSHSDRPFHTLEYSGDNREPGSFFEHPEHEFVYVTAGSLSVDLDGSVHELDVGDAVSYVGGVRHRWGSSAGPFQLLVVKERPRLGRASG
jgi:transcriptional regulator with XRE-family HTH domain